MSDKVLQEVDELLKEVASLQKTPAPKATPAPTSGFEDEPTRLDIDVDLHDLVSVTPPPTVNQQLLEMISADAEAPGSPSTLAFDELPYCEDAVEYQSHAESSPAELPALLERGTLVGAYEIEEIIGKGGMAEIYLARHTALEKHVALKRLSPVYAKDPRLVERFFAEARRASQIRHPNVIEINDLVSSADNHFLVMEYLQGMSLEERLKRDYALPLASVLDIGKQLCDAMQAVHAARVVHRDLKPSNIFLTTTLSGEEHIKLLDFGIAKLKAASPQINAFETVTGTMLGTPGYMPPEQIAGDKVDFRADIYCIGLILFEMLTGERPFAATSMSQLLYQHATSLPTPPDQLMPQKLPRRLTTLIMRCLEKDPELRPQNVEEVKAELVACEDKRLADLPQAPIRARRVSLVLWLLVLSLFLGLAAAFLYTKDETIAREDPKPPRATKSARVPAKPSAKQQKAAEEKRDQEQKEAAPNESQSGKGQKATKRSRGARKAPPAPTSFFDRF